MASSGSTPAKRPTFTAANSTSPSSSRTPRPHSTASRSSRTSSSSLQSAPEISGQSKPAPAAFFCSFSARHSPGRLRATLSMASAVVFCPFSSRLSCSQLSRTDSGFSSPAPANTWGCRNSSFLTTPSTTSSMVKRPRSRSMSAWNTTCISTSPSSSRSMVALSRSMASAAS